MTDVTADGTSTDGKSMQERRAGPRALFSAVSRGITKEINASQLKDELGGIDVFTSAGVNDTIVVLANVQQNTLDTAIAAHVARNARRDAITALQNKAKTDPTVAAILQVLGIV